AARVAVRAGHRGVAGGGGSARCRPSRGWGPAGRGAPMMRRARARPSLISGVVALGLLVVCPARDDRGAAQLTPPSTEALQVLLTTPELVVGQNRVAFALQKDGRLLADPKAPRRVHVIDSEGAQLVAEPPARYLPLEVIEQGKRIHIPPDGARHVHGDATAVQGIYVAQVPMSRAGVGG